MILTSNRTREVHDALSAAACITGSTTRRSTRNSPCANAFRTRLHARASRCGSRPAPANPGSVQVPGVSETLDWVAALAALDEQNSTSRPWRRLAWC